MGDFVRVSYKPNFKLGFQVDMRHVSSLICWYVCALLVCIRFVSILCLYSDKYVCAYVVCMRLCMLFVRIETKFMRFVSMYALCLDSKLVRRR